MENKSPLPIWLNQIKNQKKNGLIEFGLTIPYLIGCYKVYGNRISLEEFLNIVIETDSEFCAVIQKCTTTKQYVLGYDKTEFCEKYMSKCIKFKNHKHRYSLFITLNAIELGNDISNLKKTFEKLYKKILYENKYNWNNNLKDWEEFSKKQEQIIIKNF